MRLVRKGKEGGKDADSEKRKLCRREHKKERKGQRERTDEAGEDRDWKERWKQRRRGTEYQTGTEEMKAKGRDGRWGRRRRNERRKPKRKEDKEGHTTDSGNGRIRLMGKGSRKEDGDKEKIERKTRTGKRQGQWEMRTDEVPEEGRETAAGK